MIVVLSGHPSSTIVLFGTGSLQTKLQDSVSPTNVIKEKILLVN
jgi:hypothetical protein